MIDNTINNVFGVAVLHVVNVIEHNKKILVKIVC
jgi:hypothetical protein